MIRMQICKDTWKQVQINSLFRNALYEINLALVNVSVVIKTSSKIGGCDSGSYVFSLQDWVWGSTEI